MNAKMMYHKFRPKLSKILPFIILFFLTFTYQDVLRSMILVPIAYVIFIIRLISGSIGQQTLWVSFVVLTSFIAFISLLMRREEISEEKIEEYRYPTRLQIWINSLSHKRHSQYFQWNMAQDLSNLLVDVIAYKKNISRQQALFALQNGYIDLPQDIIEFIRISQKPFVRAGLPLRNSGNWINKIQSVFRKTSATERTRSPLDVNHQYIIQYIEKFLNLDNGTWEKQHQPDE
jgi:hypothetical protein